MRILFIDPPGKNKGFNTGFAYLSAMLKESHEVRVLDLNNIQTGLCGDPNPNMTSHELKEKIADSIHSFEPDLAGVSVKTFTADISAQIFSFIKTRKPDIITIAGGPHITLDGLKFIEDNRIDFGMSGEGEYHTLDLCNALEGKKSVENIEGIFYWRDNRLQHNPSKGSIEDLDAIPFPTYDNFSSVIANGGVLREYPLLTSRGCTFRCSYCSMPKIMGNRWRCHTPLRVIRELQWAKDTYRIRSFTVIDDNFTLDLNRVDQICDLLISEKINLPWNSQNGIRADRITENLAKNMKHSGCQYVWIGIENADETVFSKINKGESLQDIHAGIKHLQNAGIRVGGFFIIGLPHSTREADLKSVEFVETHGIDGFWFNFVPYPQTKAWDWVRTHGNILRPSTGVLQFGENGIDPVFETREYSKTARIQTYDEIQIRMKYFDRLADFSLKQREKWLKVFLKVFPYGIMPVVSLIIFIFRYNTRLIVKKFSSTRRFFR